MKCESLADIIENMRHERRADIALAKALEIEAGIKRAPRKQKRPQAKPRAVKRCGSS